MVSVQSQGTLYPDRCQAFFLLSHRHRNRHRLRHHHRHHHRNRLPTCTLLMRLPRARASSGQVDKLWISCGQVG